MLYGDWSALMPQQGDLAKPRPLDVMAALNRMRNSQFKASE
jgi:predicted ABC-class ATPase